MSKTAHRNFPKGSRHKKLTTKINQIIEKWQETLTIRQGIHKKQSTPNDKPNLDSKPKLDPQPPTDGKIDL